MKSTSGNRNKKKTAGSVNNNIRGNNIYSDTRKIKAKKNKKRGKFLASFLSFLLIFLACFTIGGAIYFFNINSSNPGPHSSNTESQDKITKTRRDKMEYFLIAGIDDAAYLSDVIILVAYDKINNSANLLQIPRDSYIGENIPTGRTCKINAIHNHPQNNEKGIESLSKFITSQFQIPIDHYVTFTLKGFRGVVDSVGGVEITNPKQINFSRGQVIPKGRVLLDGRKAEWFVRERHSRSGGDIGRVEAQQRFLAGFANKVKNMSMNKLASDVLPSAFEYIKTDMSINEIIDYVSVAKNISLDKINIFIMPGEQAMHQPKGQKFPLSYYSINKYDAVWLLQEHFNPYGDKPITVENFLTEVKEEIVPSKPSPAEDRPKAISFNIFE